MQDSLHLTLIFFVTLTLTLTLTLIFTLTLTGRWNGVDFQSLVQVCCGNDAYEATLLAYVDPDAWEDVPHMPPSELRGAARLVKLVSSVQGELLQIRHEQELSQLRSLVRWAMTTVMIIATANANVNLPNSHDINNDKC